MFLEERTFQLAIHDIFMSQWDPSHVRGVPGRSGQYDPYESITREMLRAGSNRPDMVMYLSCIESDRMGLGPLGWARRRQVRKVAKNLLNVAVPSERRAYPSR